METLLSDLKTLRVQGHAIEPLLAALRSLPGLTIDQHAFLAANAKLFDGLEGAPREAVLKEARRHTPPGAYTSAACLIVGHCFPVGSETRRYFIARAICFCSACALDSTLVTEDERQILDHVFRTKVRVNDKFGLFLKFGNPKKAAYGEARKLWAGLMGGPAGQFSEKYRQAQELLEQCEQWIPTLKEPFFRSPKRPDEWRAAAWTYLSDKPHPDAFSRAWFSRDLDAPKEEEHVLEL